jgi:large subunit ribosomal protein L1
MAKKAEETNTKEVIAEEVVAAPEETTVTENVETTEQSAGQTAEESAAPEAKSTETEPEHFAKSGKKSKKHIEEVEAEENRQARKLETKAAEELGEKKGPKPVVRPKIERRGKKYQEAAKKIDREKLYSLEDAIKLALDTSPTKFDATMELHVRLGVDPRQADQNIRSTVSLPNGSGKTVRVAVFAPDDIAKQAKTAGADIAADEEFLKSLDKGEINFDVLISTPQYMPKLGKYARLLGPKGLMPNPKAGTVTTDIAKAVKEAKGGKIEYRVDKQSIVHVGFGKVSFGADKLLENANAFLDSLKSQKPASIKGQYVKSIALTSTMSPSVKIENIYN